MTSNTDDLILTDDRLKKTILQDGRKVDFNFGLGSDDRKKLKDHHVMDVLTNHVNADLVTTISLTWCSGITNDTLIQISNMCPQLEELIVIGCDITDDGIVPIAEKCGQQLKALNCSYCKKCTDAALKSIVNNCNQLERLDAIDCGISTIPENIGYKLTNLKRLSLAYNKITKIPPSLTLLKETLKDNAFQISGNPLQEPPIEVAKQGLEAIERYFEEIQKRGSTISNTLKVVLVGQGKAGKTSLLRSILDHHHPLTTEEERTIYVNFRTVPIPRKGQPDLIIIFYDCGGQEEYASGQTPFLTRSALFLFVVNADETDPETYLRFFDLLQPRAEDAVVQIIVTKTDSVDNPEEQGQQILDNMNKRLAAYQKLCKENGLKDKGLRIQQHVILISVKNDPIKAKEVTIKTILDLTEVKDPAPLLPAVGQTMPSTYVKVHRIADGLRAVGKSISHEELFILVDGKDEIKSPEDSPHTGMLYCNIDVIVAFYLEYRSRRSTKKLKLSADADADDSGSTTDHITVVSDALHLYDAQGYIYIHKPLIYLNPELIGDLMAAITDHRLTEDSVTSNEFNSDIVQYVEKNCEVEEVNPTRKLKDALRKFAKTGVLSNLHVAPFLFRNTALARKDHAFAIGMFKDAGIICWSSFKGEDEDEENETMEHIIAKRHPIVIYRLSSGRPPIEKYWPEKCPDGQDQVEVHIELPSSCPPSLPPAFAAKLHSEGHCCYAWLNGAVILVKGKKKGEVMRVRADLIDNSIQDGGVYLLLAMRRPATSAFGKKEMSIVAKKLFDLVKQEKNDRLPGLLFDIVIPCPGCCGNKFEYDPDQSKDEQETEPFCEVCCDLVDMSDTLNSLAISAPLKTPASCSSPEREINIDTPSTFKPEECDVMISFNASTAGEDAVKLANFLKDHGLRVLCTNVHCPNNAGDWRDVTEAGANNCRYFITLMTFGWQTSDEVQRETKIVKNRSPKDVTIIPVFYESFNAEYDNQVGHYHGTNWKSLQGVPSKEKDPDFMNTLLKLFPTHEVKDPDSRY